MLKTYLYVPDQLNREIKVIAEKENKSKAAVMRAALKEGVKQLKRRKIGSAEILLRIAQLGKKNRVHGPRDTSIRMDDYLWK